MFSSTFSLILSSSFSSFSSFVPLPGPSSRPRTKISNVNGVLYHKVKTKNKNVRHSYRLFCTWGHFSHEWTNSLRAVRVTRSVLHNDSPTYKNINWFLWVFFLPTLSVLCSQKHATLTIKRMLFIPGEEMWKVSDPHSNISRLSVDED